MKKFLLPLTTALAALLSQNPSSEAHTSVNDVAGHGSSLTRQHRVAFDAIQIPADISSLVLEKQSTDMQMASHRSHIEHIHLIVPIPPIGRHVNIAIGYGF
jgi:hypothetical protein